MLSVLYGGRRQSFSVVTEDSFTQSNPPAPAPSDAGNTSTTIANQSNSSGILGGSVAFTRPDVGNNYIGGPGYSEGAAVDEANLVKPLGLFLNDAVGNAYENTPAIASGKNPYACGGGTYRVDLYETFAINDGMTSNAAAVGSDDALTYSAGMLLYGSVNGYLTPNAADSYEVVYGGAMEGDPTDGDAFFTTATVLAIVVQAPSATSASMVIDLRV